MMFKKDQEALLASIYSNSRARIHNHLTSNLGPHAAIEPGDMTYIIQEAIAMAIEEAFRTMLEARYTDDDFEKDVGLKP